MKLLKFTFMVLLFCTASVSIGQQKQADSTKIAKKGAILTINELNKGEPRFVDPYGPQIVEINGNLEISISKDAIRKKLSQTNSLLANREQVNEQYKKLSTALANKEQLFKALRMDVLTATEDRALNTAMLEFLKLIQTPDYISLGEQYNSLYPEWDAKYGDMDPITVSYELYFLNEMDQNLTGLEQMLDGIDIKDIQISLVAYLKNKSGQNKDNDNDRVHIENFDTYANKEFFAVNRWVTSLSEDQMKDFADLSKTVDTMNKASVDAFATLKAKIKAYFADLSCLGELKQEIEDFLDNSTVKDELTAEVIKDINTFKTEVNTIVNIIKVIETDVSNWDINTVFDILTQVQKLQSAVDNFPGLVESLKNTLATVDEIETQATTFLKKINTCYGTVSGKVTEIMAGLGLLKTEQKNYLSNDDIGKEVKSFGLDNLPEQGFISLEYSGKRENGDKLEIDLILRPTDSSANDTEGNTNVSQILEQRILTMQLIGLRSETAVGIIMANPFNYSNEPSVAGSVAESDANAREFFYAPSASLLLKFGSRKSKFYNEFIDFGFGINIATPDFNTDGTPEFGFGAIFTAFKDILSAGINYNVTLNEPYWSIGINLPFNMPGIPINNAR